MSFDIKCYMNNSPRTYVTKDLTELFTVSGTLRDNCSLENPIILLEKTVVPTFNYVYIENFNRYYFVEKFKNENNLLWSVNLHVDVLSTFWNQIKTCECIVGRNEYKRINDLIDEQIWTTADSLYEVIKYENSPFDSDSFTTDERYVMILAGAGVSGDGTGPAFAPYPITSAYGIMNEYYVENGSNVYNGISYSFARQGFILPASANLTDFYFTLYTTEGTYSQTNYHAVYDNNTAQWTYTVIT